MEQAMYRVYMAGISDQAKMISGIMATNVSQAELVDHMLPNSLSIMKETLNHAKEFGKADSIKRTMLLITKQ